MKRKLINTILISALLLWTSLGNLAAAAIAQDMPTSALTSYDTFRSALLKYGWLPDQSYGVRNDDGTPMYKHPEIICGNSLCSAQWIAKNQKKLQIIIWRDDAGDYRVAPQIDWPE